MGKGRGEEGHGEPGFGRDEHARSPHPHSWGDSGSGSLGRWMGWEERPPGREGVGLSPTLAVSGIAGPVLPWQPDRSLIDSQERTLPCMDPQPFRKPLV